MRQREKIGVPAGLFLDLVCTTDRENGLVYIDPDAWHRFVRGVEAARGRPEGLRCHDDGSIEWDGTPLDIPQPTAARIIRALFIHGPLAKYDLMDAAKIESEKTLEYAVSRARLSLYAGRIPLTVKHHAGQYHLIENITRKKKPQLPSALPGE